MLLLGTAAKEKHIWNVMKELQLCKLRMDINLVSETIKQEVKQVEGICACELKSQSTACKQPDADTVFHHYLFEVAFQKTVKQK